MKIVDTVGLVNHGHYMSTPEYARVRADIERAVSVIVNPPGSSTFTLNISPKEVTGRDGKPKMKTEHQNGVGPVKDGFCASLSDHGWAMEYRPAARSGVGRPGAFDCHLTFEDSDVLPFAVEWETGNISSSHRAINRLAVGIMNENISGGILVVPSKAMKKWFTDRIGNAPELEPYHELWRQFDRLTDAPYYLGIVVIEHDDVSPYVPHIEQGTDGRALI